MYSPLSSTKSSKPSLTLTNAIHLIIGKWRLYWNYCPECNSNAPKLHHCDVCNADTKSLFNWSKEVEARWWNKFIEKHNGHHAGTPTISV